MRMRLERIKADILCELIGVSVVRSEFDVADKVGPPHLRRFEPSHLHQELKNLIAHTRTCDVFDEFSSRIVLHHAHLVHSLGKNSEAMAYYTVASALSDAGSFVDVAATLGRAELFIGLSAHSTASVEHKDGDGAATSSPSGVTNNEELLAFGSRAVRLTKGMGCTLEAAGSVIQAAASTEILRAK